MRGDQYRRVVPFPSWLARANRRFANPLLIGLAARPPFAALNHTGRVSGRSHRIPINAFPTPTGFVIACTYGPNADWVRNVQSAGEAVLEYDGDHIAVWRPRLAGRTEVAGFVPLVFRTFLAALRVDDYMILDRRHPEAA